MTYSTSTPHLSTVQSCLSKGFWYPSSPKNQAFGVNFLESPLKEDNFTPPQDSPPCPSSHLRIWNHALSFTALCIGTTVCMSSADGFQFLRFMASKNCF
ncbi:hypothetical protein WICPIJ_008438 [Wickerhamomyces pijperi]|uniref:Uncharacterized protein n=1 Tax=Wickerhamomyces pijperi TaxID=599730 RepID=A0A9P8PYS8_WICPI|nr:hypothetical protein WICPIJ_008438 [Wickerhamomyces pijperi]